MSFFPLLTRIKQVVARNVGNSETTAFFPDENGGGFITTADFHFIAGKDEAELIAEMHKYLLANETKANVYEFGHNLVCELCGKPSRDGDLHSFCMDEEDFIADAAGQREAA